MYNSPVYYPSPAVQTAQQRLQMMEAQYPQFVSSNLGYQPQPGYGQQAPQAQVMIKGRPVSNEEEANAAMIDFDGSLFVFPDRAHGKIYTKQLGLDGNIVFCRYSLDIGAAPSQPNSEAAPGVDLSGYATKEELSQGLEGIKAYLSQQLDQLTQPKGGTK